MHLDMIQYNQIFSLEGCVSNFKTHHVQMVIQVALLFPKNMHPSCQVRYHANVSSMGHYKTHGVIRAIIVLVT